MGSGTGVTGAGRWSAAPRRTSAARRAARSRVGAADRQQRRERKRASPTGTPVFATVASPLPLQAGGRVEAAVCRTGARGAAGEGRRARVSSCGDARRAWTGGLNSPDSGSTLGDGLSQSHDSLFSPAADNTNFDGSPTPSIEYRKVALKSTPRSDV